MTVHQRQTAPFAQMTKGAASALGDGKEGVAFAGAKSAQRQPEGKTNISSSARSTSAKTVRKVKELRMKDSLQAERPRHRLYGHER